MSVEGGYTAIYARQSIFKADSISTDSQIADCKTIIPADTPTKPYVDKGYTGANTNRPDFQRLLTDIKSGLIKKVYVWKLDRISRSVADFSAMLTVFRDYDVEFRSYNEPELSISTSGFGKAMLQIVMIFAELERDSIQLRVRENYYSRLELGMLGGGAAPFGFDRAECYTKGKKCYMYVESKEKADTVRYLYQQYGETDRSLGSLVQWLNDSNIQTNRGKYWNSNALSVLLKNPAFVRADSSVYTYLQGKGVKFNNPVEDYLGENGLYQYGCRKIKDTTKRRWKYQNMDGDYATIAPHEGLVDSALWLKVQQKLHSNQAIGSSGKSGWSWLTGICKCGFCGKATIFTASNDIVYISCLGRRDKHCYEKKSTIRAADIEAQVEKALLDFIKSLPVKQEQETQKNAPEVNRIKIEMAKITDAINEQLDNLANTHGAMLKYITERVNKLDAQKKLLATELTQLTVDSARPVFGGFDLDDVVNNWAFFDLEQKKAVAKVFITQVTVWDKDESGDIIMNIKLNGGGTVKSHVAFDKAV